MHSKSLYPFEIGKDSHDNKCKPYLYVMCFILNFAPYNYVNKNYFLFENYAKEQINVKIIK